MAQELRRIVFLSAGLEPGEYEKEGHVMNRSRGRWSLKLLLALAVIVSSFAISGGAALARGNSGAVYTLTNSPAGNEVAVFSRMADGSLTRTGSVATGGLGSGDGLGSQGAVVLSQNNNWLLAVNAGSNDLSVLRVQGQDLHLADVVPSGGVRPISVTINRNIIYVLNDGGGVGAGNITGFWINALGELAMIPGSTQPLSGDAVGPAQVQFSPHGNQLIVTEKMTNQILTFAVDRHGLAGAAVVNQSKGMTPFGFDFTKRGDLVVSEAFGGAENASAVSSYRVNSGGGLHTRSASVATAQTAACWVVVTNNGKFAYVTNTQSASVSGYAIGRDGSLTLLNEDGRTGETGETPIDVAFSRNDRFLYTLNSGSDSISAFEVMADGSLVAVDGVDGLIDGYVGLASR